MYKLLLLPLLLTRVFCSYAQSTLITPELGINATNVYSKSVNGKNKYSFGLKIGGAINIPFSNNGFLSTGLFYSQKGYDNTEVKHEASRVSTTINDYTINYIELPINVLYRLPIERIGALSFSAGPYLAYGINGKIQTSTTESISGATASTKHSTERINWNGSDNQFKHLDIGFNTGIAYELPINIYIRVQYGMSVTSISNHEKRYYQNWQLTLGSNIWTWYM